MDNPIKLSMNSWALTSARDNNIPETVGTPRNLSLKAMEKRKNREITAPLFRDYARYGILLLIVR